jgi:hypothetical protein
MMPTNGSAGSHATLTKPYDYKTDSKDHAFEILNIMSEMAASRSLSDHVKLDPAPAMLAEPNAEGAGATVATRAQYEIDMKKYETQRENFNDLILDFKKLMAAITFAFMLHVTGTKIFTSLSPRDIYRKFKKAFCTLTGSELTDSQLDMQRVWPVNTDLTDFVSVHASARERVELTTEATPQLLQVLTLEIALRNLFESNVKFASKAQIRAEHLPFATGPDCFTEYVRILLEHIRSGEFNDVQKPIAKVNAVKEHSAGGARSRGPPLTPEERSKRDAANKKRFASCPLDDNCPVHTSRNKEGTFHKWGECHVYTGKFGTGSK